MKPNWRRMWKATEWTLATSGALALGISFAHAALLWELCASALLAALWYGFYSISLTRAVGTHRTADACVPRRSVNKRARNRSGAARDTAILPSRPARPAKRDLLPQKLAPVELELLIDGVPASQFTKLDPSRFIQ